MTQFNRESVLGKWVEVIMDSDHSTEVFSRRGKIVHVFSNPPAKEAVAIELEKESGKRSLKRNKNQYLILEYPLDRKYSLESTLVSGSFARVLRPRQPKILDKLSYSSSETRPIGFAEILPWPRPPEAGQNLARSRSGAEKSQLEIRRTE